MVHLATECATCYIVAKVLDTISKETLINSGETEIIHQFGEFKRLVLDLQPVHNCNAMKQLAQKYDFELQYSPSYCHNLTGLAECLIKNLQQTLKFMSKIT